MNKTKWINGGNVFRLYAGSDSVAVLPPGIYSVRKTNSGFHLEQRDGGFKMPEKIYGIEDSFIARCQKTFEHACGNLGILLKGVRGTGKTVTAERIAERLALPIVLVEENHDGLVEFLSEIPHAVTFLFDEFEKRFPDEQGQVLLSLMDGTSSTEHRKVFLLTTNDLRVEENFLQRPGRVRYIKSFSNLKQREIEEIVDDRLSTDQDRKSLINFIASLQLITVDIVTSLVEEMNIHGGNPEDLQSVFNVKRLNRLFDVYEVDDAGEKFFKAACQIHPFSRVSEDDSMDLIGFDLRIEGGYFGEISKVDGDLVTAKKEDGDEVGKCFRIVPKQAFNEQAFGKKFAGLNGAHP